MDEKEISEILRLERPLTTEEQVLLTAWYAQFPEYHDLTFDNPDHRNRIARELRKQIEVRVMSKPKKLWPILLRTAAIITVVIGSWWFWQRPSSKLQSKSSTQTVRFTAEHLGKNQKMVLPDGSKATLFPGTEIIYRNTSLNTSREVTLIGMAHFDVIHNAERPFIVRTAGNVSTTALGTSFTVSALAHTPSATIALHSGRIQIRHDEHSLAILDTKQQLRIDTLTGKYATEPLEKAYASWLTGQILLRDATMAELASIIALRYGVLTEFNPKETANLRFNLQFNLTTSQPELLETIFLLAGLRHEQQGNIVRFSFNN